MRLVLPLGVALAFLLFSGVALFASSDEAMVVGYAAPEYKGKGLKKILVHARTDNAFFRDQLERRARDAIQDESNEDVTVILAIDIAPPIRKYAPAEIERKISELEIDGVLFFDVAESSVAVSRGWGFSVGPHGGSGGLFSSATRYTKASIELYEPTKKELMWKGEADVRVGGGSEKSIKSSTKYLAKRVAELLKRDGLYFVPPEPTKRPAPKIKIPGAD